ncbi:hypothetical protein [Aurantibacillus circumpalustris]|uniref:hypothetical protein n=1 Tax=Aurantibacillus circumpalustris TaxID=3036359 RepID=UPI00295A8E1A|nr:hypothetical protein [Aurantibacillus circumpalustris]
MIEQDDELKDLFQQKNLEDAFSPDEQNWKMMATALENERNSKRRLFVYFSLLLTLGVGVALFFVNQNENNLVTLNPQTSSKKLQQSISGTEQSEPDQTISSIIQEKKISPHNQTKNETPEIKKTDSKVAKVTSLQPNQIQSLPGNAEQEKLTTKPTNTAKQETEKHQTPNMKKAPVEVAAVTNVYENKDSKEKPTDYEVSTQAKETPSARLNNNNSVVNDKEVDESKETLFTSGSIKPKKNNNQDNKVQNPPQKNSTNSDSDFIISSPDELLTDALEMKTITIFTDKPDYAPTAIVPIRDSILPKKLLSHRIFLEAGMNYQLGWKTNNKTEANGINPLVGLQYYHDVSRRFGLSLGLFYTSINNLSATSHTSTTTRLKFGEEIEATVVTAKNMHYLLLPLKLSYSFSRNDFVCIGYTLAYLLDVASKIETFSTRLNYSSTPVVSKSMGYTKGFNPYDGQIAVCYRRRLYKELYVNGEFFYGLSDIKNDIIYKLEGFERAYGFRLSVGINLWKK